MIVRNFLITSLMSLCLAINCFSQGETALPFLLISPITESNSMGEVSVATSTLDPLAMTTNPAHLGMQVKNGSITFGYNHSNWLPRFLYNDLYYRTFGIIAGMSLNDFIDIAPVVTFGAGYSRIYLNLGDHILPSLHGPEPIDKFRSYESSDQFTLSAGIDYLIGVSAGITFKSIHSHLSPIGTAQESGAGIADVNAYDVGLLLNLPVAGIVSRIKNKPVTGASVSPFLDINFGMAFNNLGNNEVIYIDADQADPLPRYARIGMGTKLGFTYERNGIALQPVAFQWAREANDILVHRYTRNPDGTLPVPLWRYRSGLGEIRFLDDVILGKSSSKSITKSGWEFDFFEIVYIRGGRFKEHEDRGNRDFTTEGFSLRLAGLAKLLNTTETAFTNNNIINFILNHLDIRYHYSEYKTREHMHPLDGRKSRSVVISVYR